MKLKEAKKKLQRDYEPWFSISSLKSWPFIQNSLPLSCKMAIISTHITLAFKIRSVVKEDKGPCQLILYILSRKQEFSSYLWKISVARISVARDSVEVSNNFPSFLSRYGVGGKDWKCLLSRLMKNITYMYLPIIPFRRLAPWRYLYLYLRS